jgi:hypothetical protein
MSLESQYAGGGRGGGGAVVQSADLRYKFSTALSGAPGNGEFAIDSDDATALTKIRLSTRTADGVVVSPLMNFSGASTWHTYLRWISGQTLFTVKLTGAPTWGAGYVEYSAHLIVISPNLPAHGTSGWLNISRTGDKGDTGAKGDKGDSGAKGDTGAVGPAGPTKRIVCLYAARITASTAAWDYNAALAAAQAFGTVLEVEVERIGGGGSGRVSASTTAGDCLGGWPGCVRRDRFAPNELAGTYPVTIGAGGVAVTGTSDGNAGGDTTFGTLAAALGGAGGTDVTAISTLTPFSIGYLRGRGNSQAQYPLIMRSGSVVGLNCQDSPDGPGAGGWGRYNTGQDRGGASAAATSHRLAGGTAGPATNAAAGADASNHLEYGSGGGSAYSGNGGAGGAPGGGGGAAFLQAGLSSGAGGRGEVRVRFYGVAA